MNELKILMRDERRNFRPGETVEGVAGWRLDKPPKMVELRLFWFTRGKGTEDVGGVNQMRRSWKKAGSSASRFQLSHSAFLGNSSR